MIRRGDGQREPGLLAHVLADERDQLLERVVLRADAGAFERAVGEVGLERLDEAPVGFRRQIALDREGAGDRRLRRLEIQHRRKRRTRSVAGRKLHEAGNAGRIDEGDRAVRRAEVDSYPGGLFHAVTLRSCPRICHRDTETQRFSTTGAQGHRDPERTHRRNASHAAAVRQARSRRSPDTQDPTINTILRARVTRRERSVGRRSRPMCDAFSSVSQCLGGFVDRTGARSFADPASAAHHHVRPTCSRDHRCCEHRRRDGPPVAARGYPPSDSGGGAPFVPWLWR